MLARRIAYWAETNGALAEGHTGGRRQHSTDDAFITLTTWVKHKWRQGFIVSGLFLDVKSAYPLVHVERLIHTLRSQDCPEYLTQLIQNFLTNRSTNIRLDNFLSHQFQVNNGLPQGSPLSVILYLLYNSNLLINNPISLSSQHISIGFIDDITHLVANRDVDQNVMDLEAEGRRSLRWGKTHGAIFDKRKAQLMHFTHRRHHNPSIVLGDQNIQPSIEVRWLGLWLDPKLNFSLHVLKMQKRGKATIAQLGRISHCYWGLTSRETRKLISTVLKPRILFGSIAWLTTKNQHKVNKIFKLLQNAANRLILGAFRSLPTDLMSHDTNTISFFDLAVRSHHLFIYKRLTAPESHPTRRLLEYSLRTPPKTHLDSIHLLIGKENLLTFSKNELEIIEPYPTPPWDTPLGEIQNLGIKKDKAVEEVLSQVVEETSQGSMVVFTDGSYVQETGGGAAMTTTTSVESEAFGPVDGVTNYEMELMALSLALNHYIDHIETNTSPVNKTLAIFSNSQAALQLMINPLVMGTAQYLGQHLQELIQFISPVHTIKLYWTPGHRDIELNEKADDAARTAADTKGERISLPFSFSCARWHVKRVYNTRGAHIDRGNLKTTGRKIAEAYDKLEKGQAAIIFQLRSGHSRLNQFLARINAKPNDRCPHCGRKETTIHFLLYCPQYRRQRRDYRNALREAEIKLDTRRANIILDQPDGFPYLADFIASTNRFEHLQTYVDL